MLKNKYIGIIYTTFLRNKLMNETIQSILDNWKNNYILLIGDQNNTNNQIEKQLWLSNIKHENTMKNIHYYHLLYDCGLSYARNYLINKAYKMGIKYCLLTADSIKFTQPYNLQPVINFLEEKPERAIVGFDLLNRQPFEYDLTISKKYGKFLLKSPSNEQIGDFLPCDIVRNFFLAKTAILKEIQWDNQLKLCVTKDTPILIKNDFNQIKSIHINDIFPLSYKNNIYSFSNKSNIKIWSDKGWTKIKKISRRKTNKQIFEISTNSAYIQTTADHRFIIYNKTIEAKHLKNKIETIKYPKLSNKIDVSPEWAWMLGFFLAKGYIKKNPKNNNKRILFINQNILFLKKCEKALNNIGIQCSWNINLKRKNKCIFLQSKISKILFSYFSEFLYHGKKIIPSFVYEFNKKSRHMFIQGFFDGNRNKFPRYSKIFNQKSSNIINGIIYLSQDLYKNHTIFKQSNKYGEWFVLNLKKFHNNYKQNIIKEKKEIKYDDYVYDIETENHHFCGGIGNVNLHNCEHEDFFYRLKQTGYKTFYYNKIQAKYIKSTNPNYDKMRKRAYLKYKYLLKQKYNLSSEGSWILYAHKMPKGTIF